MNEYDLSKANECVAAFMTDEDAFADRREFVQNLGWLLSQTREGVFRCDLESPSKSEEYVIITYLGGAQKKVNVYMDSYAAIIRDVIKLF